MEYLSEWKGGFATGELGLPAMSPLMVVLVEHVVPMGLEGLGGCSRDNVGALLLPARDQLHAVYVLGGWPVDGP